MNSRLPANITMQASHFYRLHTINDFTGQASGIAIQRTLNAVGKLWTGLPPQWKRGMEEMASDTCSEHCRLLRAPATPEAYRKQYYVFNMRQGAVLPDMWIAGERFLVSERAKAVLENCDNFGHEYIETDILDRAHRRVDTMPYYLLNVRRIVQVEESGGTIENRHGMFCPDPIEEKFLPVVQRNPQLKAMLAGLPMWRAHKNWSVLYISEDTLNALEDAGITGLDAYTCYNGRPGEAVGRFE